MLGANDFAEPIKSRPTIAQKVRLGPFGFHYFNRNTGDNVLIEELRTPPDLWSTAPRQVSIAVTNTCDLKCAHCYASKAWASIPYSRLVDWLYELDDNGCIGVGFGGGEPTIYPLLPEICTYAMQETCLAVSMTTHGHHLTDRYIDQIAGQVNFVRFSMDGVRKTYEAIRKRSFGKLLERIIAASRVVRFGINYLVNDTTIEDIDDAVSIAEDLGASEFLLLPQVATSVVSRAGGNTLKTMQEWVLTYRGTVPVTVSEEGSYGLPVCQPLKGESGLSAFAHVDASSVLKRRSYDAVGVPIEELGIMSAMRKLRRGEEAITA